ncbi:hypothetical protein JW979_08205 [bacterium]|nr:hypothetical protein [candidate division CSSED10-310 bacterium]
MTVSYLSPAFHSRSEEEILFLKKIDKNSGFSIFWIDIVQPLLRHVQARHLLEIGSYRGDHTRLLAKYCNDHNGTLIIIEPVILSSLQKIVDHSKNIKLFATTSREAMPLISTPLDAVMLEGDLNYQTVYGDLLDIERFVNRQKTTFPLIFLRATGWPYARRDMYYDPTNMPVGGIHSFQHKGMSHWSSSLEPGMINYPFANARQEGGQCNGVLTAAEDFIKKNLSLEIFTLPIHNGISILYVKGSSADVFIQDCFCPGSSLISLLETVEVARLNSIINELKGHQRSNDDLMGIWENRFHRLIKRIFGIMRRT